MTDSWHPGCYSWRVKFNYAWWDDVLPAAAENEDALGPYLNPFAQRYWEKFGDTRTQAQVDRMNPMWKFARPRPPF